MDIDIRVFLAGARQSRRWSDRSWARYHAEMSIVVVVQKNDRIVIAADSLATFGDTEQIPAANAVTPKIMTVGDAVIGGSGWALYDNIMRDFLHDHPAPALNTEREIFTFFLKLWRALHDRYSMVNDQPQHKDTPFGDLDSSFLIASPGGIFHVASDMGTTRFNRFYAVGSASCYALGAMHILYDALEDADAIARQAVETAIAYDVYCGSNVDVVVVQ